MKHAEEMLEAFAAVFIALPLLIFLCAIEWCLFKVGLCDTCIFEGR